jgi:flavin reductase (DIM6/NTAB) family NADH-FMN oxidoreductase RutF
MLDKSDIMIYYIENISIYKGVFNMSFREIDVNELKINPFSLIGKEWMLITAGDKNNYNTMTASWGGFGVIWNKPVTFSFIRPNRYTFEFTESNDYFTISFYPEEYKKTLSFCGSNSGRDVNKAKETGLTPVFTEPAPYFEQARLVMICKKLHAQFIDPSCFVDKDIISNYQDDDFHKFYIGEIIKVLIKE